MHPSESISTALGRLSPTCRALWSTHWPTQKRLAALAGDEGAAQEVCGYCVCINMQQYKFLKGARNSLGVQGFRVPLVLDVQQ